MLGACCVQANGGVHCMETEEMYCLEQGGDWLGGGTHCGDATCGKPMFGACCIGSADGNVHCIETDEWHCANEGGDWQGDGTHCGDVACGGSNEGSCCVNGGCLLISPADCEMVHGHWNTSGCDQVACAPWCPGDVNGDGIVGVSDILILIADWGPCA
jgi:hypothetical protein